ncbi:1-aminocyclopropane-1-carboxylate deaminase/D-cysteine desulfhydrase [Shewanella subflava]|uniref:1-aminocyclopropane-1-carboxylate deaminase/D-cysteine desulfhydrase n=1 Tax=Shewanella subflava TaxID=2986476 RepID=A0ABT3ID91_9GAMM|nr:1-aminocyclopropane-1-carboxylate deaminase/D-cysteine desulfhydrase [Shewanella subflava]MCW3174017.1 1-aminocyclopropane-1-carboxylate deaminase/D-cysteine desulfhydrase [Shewanella subflava]
MLTNSPTEMMYFAGRQIHIKRDDLLHADFSGNKARKFYHFLINDFPGVSHIVGSGSAQANSLYSLSVLAKIKGWQLDYYVSHIAGYVKQQANSPSGNKSNYSQAIKNGANVIEIDWASNLFNACQHLDDAMNVLKQDYLRKDNVHETLFIPEGGRCEYARTGIYILGKEILNWAVAKSINKLSIFLPSGTGTTALYLQEYFVTQTQKTSFDIEVLTCSTVGGDSYLIKQFYELSSNTSYHPQIVNDGNKYHFGKLYLSLFQLWQQVLNSTGIEFDLLYDPIGLNVLKHTIESGMSNDREILYIHQGGLLGNATMLPRYLRKQALTHL